MGREWLQPQMPHICSASLSFLCTETRDAAVPLHVKKDKIGSLKTGRKKNEMKTELRNHH